VLRLEQCDEWGLMGDDYDGTRHLFLKDYGAATIILRTFTNATYDAYPFDLY